MFDLKIKKELITNTNLSINAIVMYSLIKEVVILENNLIELEIDIDDLNKKEKRKYKAEIRGSYMSKFMKVKSHVTMGKIRKELIDKGYIEINSRGYITEYNLA